jgi:hypothetical protein
MTAAQIAEYESLREEHMRNMEIRVTLTNIMVVALAAIFSLTSLFHDNNAFQVFFFVPALVGVWGEFIRHSYDVFLRIARHLYRLDGVLGIVWERKERPSPSLWMYSVILVGAWLASFYYIAALQHQSLGYTCVAAWSELVRFLQTPSSQAADWIIWLVGVVLSVWVSFRLVKLQFKFREFRDSPESSDDEDYYGQMIPEAAPDILWLRLLLSLAIAVVFSLPFLYFMKRELDRAPSRKRMDN